MPIGERSDPKYFPPPPEPLLTGAPATGLVGGAIAGAAVGGPVGAVVGAAAGWGLGIVKKCFWD